MSELKPRTPKSKPKASLSVAQMSEIPTRSGRVRLRTPKAKSGSGARGSLAEGETLDGGGDAVFVVGKSFVPAVHFEFGNAVGHNDGNSGEVKHFEVVVIVADGENFVAFETLAGGPFGEG